MMMENKNVRLWQQYQALYLHIPFCVQKCLYCDFASYAGFGEQAKRDYTDAVCKEIALRAAEAANMAANASIYFGGGTPSVLPTECIAKLVNALKQYGFWQQPCEATIEVNPGTADLAKLQTLRQLGFDRIQHPLHRGQVRSHGLSLGPEQPVMFPIQSAEPQMVVNALPPLFGHRLPVRR